MGGTRGVLMGCENDAYPSSVGSFILFYLFIFGCFGSSLLCAVFSSCGERGLLFLAVQGFLVAVTSLVAEHRL